MFTFCGKLALTGLVLLVLAPWCVLGQSPDTLYVLEEIKIEADRAGSQSASGSFLADVNRLVALGTQDAVRLMDHIPGLDIRQAGSSGAALASFRGLGAASTSIMLDGIRLMDPATGSFDLSLIPASLVRNLKAQSGTAAGFTPGGVLSFETPDVMSPGLTLEMGAFGRKSVQAQAGMARERTSVVGALTASDYEGDFPYAHPARLGHPVVRRQGADRQNASFFLSARRPFRIFGEESRGGAGPETEFRVTALGSRVSRAIPALSNADGPGADQEDALFLTGLNLNTFLSGMPIHATLSSLRSEFRYVPVSRESTLVRTSEVVLKARTGRVVSPRWLMTWQPEVRHGRVNTGREWREIEAGTRISADHVRTSLLAGAFLEYRFRSSGEHQAASEDPAPRNGHAMAPGVWMAYRIVKDLDARLAMARVVRLPTLNERFWEPGGNAWLLPERGMQMEGALEYHNIESGLQTRVVVFASRLSDRIVWRPTLAGNARHIWIPQNVAHVRGKGIEGHFSAMILPRFRATVSGTRLVQKDYSNSRAASYGRQLRFVSPWSAAIDLEYRGGRLGVFSTTRLTGRRFTATDESAWMPAQHVLDAGLVLHVRIGSLPVTAHFSGLNLTNESRVSSPWMPMPSREWRLLLTLGER